MRTRAAAQSISSTPTRSGEMPSVAAAARQAVAKRTGAAPPGALAAQALDLAAPHLDVGVAAAVEAHHELGVRLALHHPAQGHRLADEDLGGVEVVAPELLLRGDLQELHGDLARRERGEVVAAQLGIELGEEDRARLSVAHRKQYYALSRYLYQNESRSVQQARAIALRELPNLLHAVHASLDASDPDAAEFANNVNRFLVAFSLAREAASLRKKAEETLATDYLVREIIKQP
mgnify:CR=1 FL=1